MNRKFLCLGLLLVLGAASCGGDGPGLAGGRNGGGTGPTDPDTGAPVNVDSVELLASSPQLQSDGSTTVTLSAVTKNANNQIIAGVPVVFSATSGTLVVLEPETGINGVATAELTTGGDPTNRGITVTSTAGNLSSSIDVAVIGSSLQIQGPVSLVRDQEATYTIKLMDSAGNGIPNEPIEISSSSGNVLDAAVVDTDHNGQVMVQLTGNNAGTDTLTATALPGEDGNPTVTASTSISVSADNFRFTSPSSNAEIDINTNVPAVVRWLDDNGDPQAGQPIDFATTRGSITTTGTTGASGEATAQISSPTAGPAIITATNPDGTSTQVSIEFVATTPDQLILQTDPGVIGPNETSTITAIVKDPVGNLVKNATVNFTLEDITGGSLSIPSAETDSQGRAQTVYTASASTSADDGVIVTGRVVHPSTNCTSTPKVLCTDAALTVGGRALSMVFGTGNSIVENDTDTTYTKDYTLFVRDASGAGVPNTTVNLSIQSTAFYKGVLFAGPTHWFRPSDAPFCNGEDLDSDGVLDAGEDVNGDGEITPGGVAIVTPGTVTTDDSGQANFQVIYPQDHAMWVEGLITASATVAGTESRRSTGFYYPASADDLQVDNAPPNPVSPWGPADPDNDPTTPFEPAPATCQNTL